MLVYGGWGAFVCALRCSMSSLDHPRWLGRTAILKRQRAAKAVEAGQEKDAKKGRK